MKSPLIDSVFLTGEVPTNRDAFRRVLVLGGDHVGLDLARRLIREGFDVAVLGPDTDVAPDDHLSMMPDTRLDEVSGFAGGFEVFFCKHNRRFKERFGFIVDAAPPQTIPKFKDHCLTPSPDVISLTELEIKLRSGGPVASREAEYLHVAFLCGLEGGSDPAVLKRVLEAVECLQEAKSVQCYVFTRHLKVAASGLERRYRECRENGTLFFKFDDSGPIFNTTDSGTLITFRDPLLALELELQPDLLVVDEHLLPPESLKPLETAIPSSPAFSPFLQPESTRFCGVETPKAGILAVGHSRGIFSPELIEADIEAAVLAVKRSARSRLDLPESPRIDPDKCTVCLTCVRLCPHGAIGFHKHAEVDPDSCMRCGICSAECPMAAITLGPQLGAESISDTISRGLTTGSNATIVAFLCSRSAALALDSAWTAIPDHLTPVVVQCAGTISVEHILSAFERGAGGVLAAGCFKGNCASVYGTSLAEQRTAQTAQILKEAGIDPSRLLFAPVAANTPWALRKAVQELEKALPVRVTT